MTPRSLAACLFPCLAMGCISPQEHLVPLGNSSATSLGGDNFRITRSDLHGQASCMYLFDVIPLGNPAVATGAMDELCKSAGGQGKPQAFVNFASDLLKSNYIVVSIVTMKLRADAVEFQAPGGAEALPRPADPPTGAPSLSSPATTAR